MKIPRRFTVAGKDPYDGIEWSPRTSEIRNPDGTVVFRLEGVRVPSTWSSVATDVLAQKYFRRTGVPQVDEKTGQVPCCWRYSSRPTLDPPATNGSISAAGGTASLASAAGWGPRASGPGAHPRVRIKAT